jgi:hypothetical protein
MLYNHNKAQHESELLSRRVGVVASRRSPLYSVLLSRSFVCLVIVSGAVFKVFPLLLKIGLLGTGKKGSCERHTRD